MKKWLYLALMICFTLSGCRDLTEDEIAQREEKQQQKEMVEQEKQERLDRQKSMPQYTVEYHDGLAFVNANIIKCGYNDFYVWPGYDSLYWGKDCREILAKALIEVGKHYKVISFAKIDVNVNERTFTAGLILTVEKQ
ncbi:hypothetical protein HQ571_03135 [Candidatus Kuenenbacteria bacterium]|nr:hypothetical protein [Candidatus Kuenenbacteria bacterium]